MKYEEIEKLKSTLTNMMKAGCRFQVPGYGANGRVIGIGFKPYWTNPIDSKIEKLQFNFLDSSGRVIPFNFYNVVGYDVVSHDGQRLENSSNICMNIHVYALPKDRGQDSFEKVRLEISKEE